MQMLSEATVKNLSELAIKEQITAGVEAIFAQNIALKKENEELKAVIQSQTANKQYWSVCGWMTAKQVAEFLGCKIHRVYELGYSKKLKTGNDGSRKIFFKDNVIAFKQQIEAGAGVS